MREDAAMRVTGYRSRGVGAAAALVNAVTSREGDDRDEVLRAILGEHGFFVQHFTAETATALRPWARTLRSFFEAESLDAAVALLNDLLGDVPMHPHVADHDALGLHLHYAPPQVDLAHRVRATTLMNLAELLCDNGIDRIGVCAAAGCDRVYADDSRGGRRRFCSDACANRTNVAAYRARRRTAG
jgi:predicted RNA-binding Zn ribbon-like protein